MISYAIYVFSAVTSRRVPLIFRRTCSTVKNVRVRFAPSPTGNLHLGGLRTALFNYLFARKNGGKFILRLEDTDQKRIKEGSSENIQEMLCWAGIEPDESPFIGGPKGPYVQSQRRDKYVEKATELLEKGAAYRCFCSEDRLEVMRKEAMKNRQNPGYDNKCRHLSPSEVQECLKKEQSFTLRFKLSSGPMTFNDLVFGSHTLDVSEYEGDFIILKSDGFPTYHFACVVDDHYMDISHVLRGAEWLASTTKHLMLHRAFDWDPPCFAHLPLLVNSDRSKLSKRQEALGVEYFKDKGCEPLALLNFVASAGSGFGPQSALEVLNLKDLSARFSLSDMSTNSSVLDVSKLEAYSQKHLIQQLSDQASTNVLIEKFRTLLKNEFGERCQGAQALTDSYIQKIFNLYKDRASKLSDFVQPEMQYLWTMPDKDVILNYLKDLDISENDALEALVKVTTKLVEVPESDYTKENLFVVLKTIAESEKMIYVNVMRMLRVVLTGRKNGPGVAEILSTMGPDVSLMKLKNSVEAF